ncbi:Enoyl-CoA hydratase [Bosea sp. LC85]|uniref:pilus assembly protein TadG-related protein n=1 Tax=Bosea sp. LC85 TaxID=1502851 RepID=UPI0004E2C3F0|nr:pilus assembly protein TadG-related protein [Bosea sp. LC85]KFC75484.1 Enoyl-CoA hydratase [Bosea sp. LC85]
MFRRFDSFVRDQRGGTALLFAAGIFMLLGFGAMAIDVGSFFYQKRRQQTANDLAALAAAADLPKARAAAQASAGSNGFAASNVQAVVFGVYTPDPALAPVDRFKVGPVASANAVKVDMAAVTPMFLGRIFAASATSRQPEGASSSSTSESGGDVPIGTSAIGVQDVQASFAVGSRLLKLDGGVLNGLLSGLLGSSVSLSIMDYEALATARIDLFDFSRRLATRMRLSAVSFNDVLNANVKLPDVLAAAADAARDHSTSNGSANSALSRIAAASSGSTNPVPLKSLVSFGTLGDKPLSGANPIAVSLSALDMVSALAQISNGARQIDIGLALNIPGLAAVTLKLGIGERPIGTSMVSVGRSGSSVHTAQTRLLLTVDLVGSGQASLVRLPLYLELASATAKLTNVQCSPGDVTTSRVTLGVQPALIDAWIGQVSNAEFNNFTSKPNPPAAPLLNVVGLAKVTGRAHATMTNLTDTPVNFSYADILRSQKRTTSTQNFVATLLSRLVGDLDLKVEALGLGLPLPGLGDLVSGVISGAATPIDQLLNSVLGTLGIGLGQADSWVSGVRCGGSVLVN